MDKDKKWALEQIDDYMTYEGSNQGRNALKYAKRIIEKLDKPDKPVVPKFVAEWINKNKDGYTLYGAHQLMNNSVNGIAVNKWVYDEDNEETFNAAWTNGYTVEVEKKYKVKLFDGHLLGRYQDGELAFVQGLTGATTSFTETEIKDIDSKLWPFAEEVSE